MNNRQLTRKLMQGRVANFFDDNAATFDTFVPLKTEIENFFSKMGLLNAAELLQGRDFSELNVIKNRVWQEWVTEVVQYACLAHAWAQRTQNDVMDQFSVKASDLLRKSQEESAHHGRELVRVLKIYDTQLTAYGVSRDMLDMLDEKIEGFESMIPDIDHAITHRKEVTVELELALDAVDATLKVIDDLIKGKYLVSKPALVREYRMMRKIGDTPTRHTTLRVTLYHEGTTNPFEGAIALIRELNRSAVTNIDGVAEILEFRDGKYHVDLIVDGVVKKTLILQIKRGKVVELVEAI